MPTFEDYYASNPISVVDQNLWDDKIAEVALQYQQYPSVYTPMVDWVDRSAQTGAQYSYFTELLEGDVNPDPIPLDAQYIANPLGIDSRQRRITINRYGKSLIAVGAFSLN